MVRAFIESAEYRQRFGGAPSGDQEATKLAAAVKHDWNFREGYQRLLLHLARTALVPGLVNRIG